MAFAGERISLSHVTSSLMVIHDLEILKRVIKNKFPKLVWKEGQKKYSWYQNFLDDWGKENENKTARARGIDPSQYGHCDHCIELPGCAYSIGVTARKDGGYSLVWDIYRGQAISSYIGTDAEKISTAYSEEYAYEFSQNNGFMMNQQEDSEFIYISMTQ